MPTKLIQQLGLGKTGSKRVTSSIGQAEADVYEAVRGFAKMGKLWKIHFRNVTSPIPDFVETFVDGGYTNMKKLMRTLVEVDFRGILIADHVPGMVGGKTGWAYSIGYIKALYDMARA